MKHSPDFDFESRRFTTEGIRYIAETFRGPSCVGTHETDTADYLREVLKPFSDSVSIQEVKYRPDSGVMSFIAPAAIMISASVIFFAGRFSVSPAYPVTATIMGLFALCWFVYGFIFGKPFGDFLLRRGKGKNVYAVRNASAGASKRVIVCANLDQAPEYRYSTGFPSSLIEAFVILYAACMVVSVVMFTMYLIQADEGMSPMWARLAVIQLIGILVYIPALFFLSMGRRVRGAAHNLSGVYAAIGIMRELAQSSYRYTDTEVCCLLTCGKNAGHKGAASFIKKHSDELKKTKTTVIVLESLCKTDELSVAVRDESGLCKISDDLFAVISHAAGNVGAQCGKGNVKLGSTDAVPFIHSHVNAAAIRAIGKQSRQYYPNRFDSTKTVNAECIEAAMKTVTETINLLSV